MVRLCRLGADGALLVDVVGAAAFAFVLGDRLGWSRRGWFRGFAGRRLAGRRLGGGRLGRRRFRGHHGRRCHRFGRIIGIHPWIFSAAASSHGIQKYNGIRTGVQGLAHKRNVQVRRNVHSECCTHCPAHNCSITLVCSSCRTD
jgi:hypothetical protein